LVLSAKTLPLLSELHRNSNDKPSNSQGLTETRCGREDGVEQDVLMSPNPRGKLEDLDAGCMCVCVF